MLAVTALSSYLYCPRKLYLEYVLKLAPPPKDILVKGSIKHKMFEEINKAEEMIVTSINKQTNVAAVYKRVYYDILKSVIKNNLEKLKEVEVDPIDVFRESWDIFLREARIRIKTVSDFIARNNIYGKELWEKLTPKYLSETWVSSEKLGIRGIVDRIEVNNEQYIPFELKSGKAPDTGVWPNHRIQLVAYLLLMSENYGRAINQGFVEYIDLEEKRRVVLDPFAEQHLKDLILEVNHLLHSEKVPEKVDNENKCNACGLKDKCFKLRQEYVQNLD
ncbi:MAG: CRISPR-associated protein Cas4 [Nanoarchaeota archaeon]|nr:CRISPR-associated protein Cas4 [Nanoarchaeota archaeon]